MQKMRMIEFGPANTPYTLDHSYSNDTTTKSATKDLNKQSHNFSTVSQPNFRKDFNLVAQHLEKNQQEGFRNIIFSDSAKQSQRLKDIFSEINPSLEFNMITCSLSKGFKDLKNKICCYTDHEIFERYYSGNNPTHYSSGKAITLKELRELKPGDFITHSDHGIGKFAGLQKTELNGKKQEVIRLVYKDNDLLFVSIYALHKISRYSGKEGHVPQLSKLGTQEWEKKKSAAKKKVKDIAKDLISLYARRKASPGFSFSKDTYLQEELESSFMFEDTPDQISVTADVKKDMESKHPMDRLICGDVGFGKTEVAIRASFKAVADNKQVAILVPTTILAFQHYGAFKERLRDFPCNIEFINRFKSTAQIKTSLNDLTDGKIDIIIGTHRLLSKDVKFKDLGLLVIDEEQKFGVTAKERLKQMRVNADTLTLTATPIPRTLQFSLMGSRDLSLITTPPPNRQPIETLIHLFEEDLIKHAVDFEVQRNGQVFLVHNRIDDIKEMGGLIQRLCPYVKIGIAHGKMESHELEKVMIKFYHGEYDVLVATTLIESGLDVPNANTIIINRAQSFGLSELHQLRGRVGRSNKKAFCYMLTPPLTSLTSEAKRRLSALEEFSYLGAGFNIAMRDLDIRGAGNLLGAEQSGFIADIGFDLYHQILDEAMRELKQDEFKELFSDTT
ncbi:MAG: transcription-repair coupling factor, partial [Bacteroidetes bacterium RIFCSPLOWO2_02_FULL_36_8]